MGILQVNIQSFTWGAGDPLGYLGPRASNVDAAAYFLQATLLEGKFYPIFAFLFGVGMALQMRKLRRRAAPGGPTAAALYRRRLYVLLGLGVAHGLLLYSGDVLAAYAVCALAFSAVQPRRLRALAWLAAACSAVALASLLLPVLLPNTTPVEAADQIPLGARVAHETYVYKGLAAQLEQRAWDELWQQTGSVLGFWPQVIALIALGVLAGRLGWLRHPERHARGWRRAGLAGLAIGLPCAIAGAALSTARARATPGIDAAWDGVILGASSLLAAAYVWAGVTLLARPWARGLQRWLAWAGRMSLSNYVSQSLAMGALLSGWGLGIGAWASRAQLAGLALLIFGVQLLISRWALTRFSQGPLEALWRRWTYGAPG